MKEKFMKYIGKELAEDQSLWYGILFGFGFGIGIIIAVDRL